MKSYLDILLYLNCQKVRCFYSNHWLIIKLNKVIRDNQFMFSQACQITFYNLTDTCHLRTLSDVCHFLGVQLLDEWSLLTWRTRHNNVIIECRKKKEKWFVYFRYCICSGIKCVWFNGENGFRYILQFKMRYYIHNIGDHSIFVYWYLFTYHMVFVIKWKDKLQLLGSVY